MAARKKKAAKKANKAKKTKTAKAAKKKIAKRKVKKTARKAAGRKTVVRKAAPKTAAKKKKAARRAGKDIGEGNYGASRRFRKSEEAFVKANKGKIESMGEAAKAALEGPEGDALRAAEAEAASHASGKE